MLNAHRLVTLLRPTRSTVMTALALLIIMPVGFLALPLLSFAANVQRGGDVTVNFKDTLTEDAYLIGSNVDFRGTAKQDATILAFRADVPGTIEGSLDIVAGQAKISGRINGTLRIAGGDVTITGAIGGDVMVLGGKVNIPSRASIGGDLILAGGQVDVRGTVRGDIQGNAGNLVLAGTVQGNVDVSTNQFDVRSTSRITGNLTLQGVTPGNIADGATIGGTIERPTRNPWDSLLDRGGVLGPIMRALWSLIAGVTLILIAPVLAERVSDQAGRPLRAVVAGLVALVAVPLLALLLVVSLVGIPVGLILLGGYLAALYLSQVAAGLAIGRFILPRNWHDGSRGYLMLAMTLGVLILIAVRLIPVAWVGSIAGLAITVWGFGALVLMIGGFSRTTST